MRHFLSIADLTAKEILLLIRKGVEIKRRPQMYSFALERKSLLTIFDTYSLRTKLSFHVAMTQLGGHAIYYHLGESTLGKKESTKEFIGSASRYVDAIAARVFDHDQLGNMAKFSSVPIINAMTNKEHPCQALGDLMTIYEKFRKLKGVRLAYVGIGRNNVTHSLLLGCARMAIDISVATPEGSYFEPLREVINKSIDLATQSGSDVRILNNAREAVIDADIVYTDLWIGYKTPRTEEKLRKDRLMPFQVNNSLMSNAGKHACFMHCLPAQRGNEVTDDVIDSNRSIIFDQAENRLHVQKALLLKLMT